jgi:nuclear transport factor 2 (NTF2) superfamily protein
MLDEAQFGHWLTEYGQAWESRDADRFCALFTENAAYRWTPLDPPLQGRVGIATAFMDAVNTQRNIRFTHELLALTGVTGICRWRCRFDREGSSSRVMLDGIFVVRFDDTGRCSDFREWWHSSEPRAAEERVS